MNTRVRGGLLAGGFVVAITMCSAVTQPVTADIVIDDFSTTGNPNPWPFVLNAVGSLHAIESNVAGVIGLDRRTSISSGNIGIPGVDYIQAGVFANPGIFDFNSTSGASGQASFLYGGSSGNLNTSFAGESGLAVEFLAFDAANAGSMTITAELFDGVNSAIGTTVVSAPGAQTAVMNFAGFSGIGSLNLGSIDRINFWFNGGGTSDLAAGTDFRLDSIHTFTIPAAPTIAILLSGLAGCTRRRRA